MTEDRGQRTEDRGQKSGEFPAIKSKIDSVQPMCYIM